MSFMPISLGGGSAPTRFGAGGITRHLNCYVEQQGEDAKSPAIVVAAGGLSTLTTLSAVGCRAMIEVYPYIVVVYGRKVYRVDEGGGSLLIGGFPTSGPVSIKKNRRDYPHVGLVADGLFYVVDTQVWTITQISIAGLYPPTSLAMLDGYAVLPQSKSRFTLSNIDDMTTVNLLSTGKAESDPDEIIKAEERDGEIVMFGADTVEWFRDAGTVPFAFARTQAIHIGCLCAGGVHKVDRTLAWIARDGTVRMMEGYDGKRISTHGVERDIAAVDPSTITSTSWSKNGHTFIAWSAPTWTRVYNLTTGTWHDRESYNRTRWRVDHVVKFGNRNIAGDDTTGGLYIMGPEYYDEAGSALVMTIQTPPVHAFPYPLRFEGIYIDIIPGVGANSSAAADLDPMLMVSWSDNGGKTWSAERLAPLGRQGDYLRRVRLTRLGVGSTVGRTFKFSCSAAVAKAIQGASVDATKVAVRA